MGRDREPSPPSAKRIAEVKEMYAMGRGIEFEIKSGDRFATIEEIVSVVNIVAPGAILEISDGNCCSID